MNSISKKRFKTDLLVCIINSYMEWSSAPGGKQHLDNSVSRISANECFRKISKTNKLFTHRETHRNSHREGLFVLIINMKFKS